MTGLQYNIKAYQALKTLSNNVPLDHLACDIYNIIEAVVLTLKDKKIQGPVNLGPDIDLKYLEKILEQHWNTIFPVVSKNDINKAIGINLK